MLIADAPNALRLYLKGRSLDLEQSATVALIDAVIEWFELERATDAVSTEPDGDMLLYQWGTYDWGEGLMFNYNITRQFVAAADDIDDQPMWQLSLTACYSATDEAVSLGSANRWCSCPDACDDLRHHIEASQPRHIFGSRLRSVSSCSSGRSSGPSNGAPPGKT